MPVPRGHAHWCAKTITIRVVFAFLHEDTANGGSRWAMRFFIMSARVELDARA
jgi:hypothetical protein